MTQPHSFFRTLIVLTLLSASAAVANVLPEVQREGDITYITGGIGDEERDALKAVEPEYNLRIMSASRSGAFEGDTTIAILDHLGEQVVENDAGPIFYANLPPGRYTVEASSSGQVNRQKITIVPGKAEYIHFSWR